MNETRIRFDGPLGATILSAGILVAGYIYYSASHRAPDAPEPSAPPAGGTTALAGPPTGTPLPAPPPRVEALPLPLASRGLFPSPAEQGAAHKQLVEGHWHGMELIELTLALMRVYRLDPRQHGLLVDEVSLEAAEAGILAGDVVRSVAGMRVATLRDFEDATYVVRNEREAEIGLWRGGAALAAVLRTERPLGYAMSEAASPIPPGAIPPHKNLDRPCTDCHIIMVKGGQLAIDAGDLLPLPPAIAADARAPHGDRGACNVCHVIVGARPLSAQP